MVFSETVFLFLFLPVFLAAHAVVPHGLRNGLLLAASILFYAWGEEVYVLVLLASIGLNFLVGLGMAPAAGRARRLWLWGGIAANLLMLGYFKYWGFLLANLGLPEAAATAPALPIGISFYTFQAMSYLIDLYYDHVRVQRSPFRLALYISMFPQLVAGPIVRYAEVEAEIADRKVTRSDVSYGVHRFVVGLAKKTLIADPLSLVADQIFAIPAGGLGPGIAWLGAVCYALQLYFDFSAYSDMAIGLGRILGFRFPENFDHPYAARSVTEFWRRWHMTLSRWFRDYLYIPLGGNRGSPARTYLNLWIVFLATGLWHGAAWTFVFWGAYHGAFLILERLGLGRALAALPRALQHGYLVLVVVLGWVPFRAESFAQTVEFYRAMLLWQSGPVAGFHPVVRYADGYVALVLGAAALLSVPVIQPVLRARVAALPPGRQTIVVTAGFWALFVVSVISVGAAAYSPFIYFRF